MSNFAAKSLDIKNTARIARPSGESVDQSIGQHRTIFLSAVVGVYTAANTAKFGAEEDPKFCDFCRGGPGV